MKKINVVLSVVLAVVIMFSVGAFMFERGRQAGVNEYSQYIEEQNTLEKLNTVFGGRLGYR